MLENTLEEPLLCVVHKGRFTISIPSVMYRTENEQHIVQQVAELYVAALYIPYACTSIVNQPLDWVLRSLDAVYIALSDAEVG